MGLCGACPFLLSSCDSRPRGLDCALCRFGNFWHNLHFAPVLSGLILPYGERSGVSNHGYCPGNAACRADGFRAARRSVRRLSARTRRRCRTVQIGAKQALGPVSAGVSLRAPSTKRWIFVAPALSGSPSSPRTRPDRTGLPRFGAFRRGGRVVECTALEMRHRCKPIGGSNPSLSASRKGHRSCRCRVRRSGPRVGIRRSDWTCSRAAAFATRSAMWSAANCGTPAAHRRMALMPGRQRCGVVACRADPARLLPRRHSGRPSAASTAQADIVYRGVQDARPSLGHFARSGCFGRSTKGCFVARRTTVNLAASVRPARSLVIF